MARPTQLVALAMCLLLGASACSTNGQWTQTGPLAFEEIVETQSVETDSNTPVDEPSPTVIAATQPAVQTEAGSVTGEPPAALAFADTGNSDDQMCEATTNVLVRTEALSNVGANAPGALSEVAYTRIAEWMERATLLDHPQTDSRVLLFGSFRELREIATNEFDSDWNTFQISDRHATSPAGALFAREYAEMIRFVNEECVGVSLGGLEEAIEDQADELIAGWGSTASTITASNSLPGHSIFTHTNGRLIASFPGHWEHRELNGAAIVDFVAAREVDAMLNMEAGEGVHIQLIQAESLDAFRALMDATSTASNCTIESDTSDQRSQVTITQDWACDDHARFIEGRFSADHQSGLIIEASFRGEQATSPQLTRLASVLQSILWS